MFRDDSERRRGNEAPEFDGTNPNSTCLLKSPAFFLGPAPLSARRRFTFGFILYVHTCIHTDDFLLPFCFYFFFLEEKNSCKESIKKPETNTRMLFVATRH